jgi:hypothetical protein
MRKWGLLAACLLTGCGTNLEPTQAELKSAWEARNLTPVNYKADIVAYMRTYLNDPRNVRNAAVSTPALKTLPGDPGDRIVTCVRYSAKTSTGQYGATKTGVAVFVSGRLDRFIETPIVVRDVCKDAELIAFPELQQMTRS